MRKASYLAQRQAGKLRVSLTARYGPAPMANADANLALLATALCEFLLDVERLRAVCIKHAAATEVLESEDGSLGLRKRYVWTKETERKMLAIAKKMAAVPDGRMPQTPATWQAPSLLIGNWVAWEATEVFVSVAREDATLTVTTYLLRSPFPFWSFPLRRVAALLRCHESLEAGRQTGLRWIERGAEGRSPIQRYLLKEMRGSSVLEALLRHW